MTTLQPDLSEARRLFDAGLRLVKLKPNLKEPEGLDWNHRPATSIDADATGYGLLLQQNKLCSVDPDRNDLAVIGMRALGFDLEQIMAAGVRTKSTRDGSGGRSAFAAEGDISWLKFRSPATGTVLELRAHSENLQDTIPGLVYVTKTGEICTQTYANCRRLDDVPPLPDDLFAWWEKCSTDIEFLREQERLFFAAIGTKATESISTGKTGGKLAFDAPGVRGAYNDANKVTDILTRHDYSFDKKTERWAPPTATGAPGVRPIPGKDGLWRSDHASDPLSGTFDAWIAHVVLDHEGDVDAAVTAWKTGHPPFGKQKPAPNFGDGADADGVIPDPPAALVQSFDQFIGARKPVVWAVQNMIQRGYIYSLTARWGHGKTAVTLPLGMHVAHGMPWAGFKVEQTRVLYLAGENPDDVRLRAVQAAQVFGMDPEVLAENMFFTTRALNLTAAEQAAVLVDQVAALGIGLCFVDTGVAHSAMEEENSNAEMHDLAVALRRLSDGLAGAAVICLMHPPKASSRDTLTTRGGGAFAGEIDGELLLWQDGVTKQVELFHGTKLRGPGFKPVFFELQRHEMDMADNFGDLVQTVVAVPVGEGSAGPRAARETPAQHKALDTLMLACRKHLTRDVNGLMRGVHVEDWRAVFYSQSTADTADAKRMAYHRARNNLHAAGLVSVCDDFYLPTDAGRLAVLALMKAHRDGTPAA